MNKLGEIKKFVLEEIVDPLVVNYLKRRIQNSEHWKQYTELSQINLDMYDTPRQMNEHRKSMVKGERLFEELYDQIKTKRIERHTFVVIDTKTKDWKLTENLAEAEKVVRFEMKNPKYCYFRPLYTPKTD